MHIEAKNSNGKCDHNHCPFFWGAFSFANDNSCIDNTHFQYVAIFSVIIGFHHFTIRHIQDVTRYSVGTIQYEIITKATSPFTYQRPCIRIKLTVFFIKYLTI